MPLVTRLRSEAQRKLANLARELNTPRDDVLDRAVEQYRRSALLAATERAYSACAGIPDVDAAAWEAVTSDGFGSVTPGHASADRF